MLATFHVFGRLLFLWDCALVCGDRANLQFILLGVDPRIENVMVCVPREWQIFGFREVHIFVLVDGDQFDRVAFFLSVAYFAQFHCSCTQRICGTWFDVDFDGQIDLEGI